MLLTPMTTCIKGIPPGFIDYASSCFDAILYPNLGKLSNNIPLSLLNNNNNINENNKNSSSSSSSSTVIQHRTSHLPDLIPFIKLITEKCNVHPVHLIMALMYVQRFRKSLPSGYKAEPEAAHRIFVASLLVASKYSEDHCLSTKQVVRATGDVWSIKEITRMELGLLRFLQWDLYIHPDEMIQFLEQLGFDANWIFTNNNNNNSSPSA